MDNIWGLFIKRFIIFTGLSVAMFYICLSSENEKILKCSKNTDNCQYFVNTNINSTLQEKASFKISEVTSLKMRTEKKTSRRRKGRIRNHYRYLIDMYMTNGSKLEYPLHAKNSSSQYTAFQRFSEYLKNNQDSYYDYAKSDNMIWGIIVATVFLLLSIASIFTLKRELKEYKSNPPHMEIIISQEQTTIVNDFFNYKWWKTACVEDVEAEIAKGANIKEKNNDGRTPLMYAAGWNENTEIIKALVNLGANVNERDNSGNTPLMDAANLNENPDIIKTLVELGADVSVRDEFGNTPLMDAARRNKNPEIIKTLVNLGANVNERSNYDETSLMYAAENNDNPDVIKILVELGADVNVRDKFGETSLMHAAEWNENTEIIKTLVNLGANVNERDYAGRTALIYATENNDNPDVIKILTELSEHNEY